MNKIKQLIRHILFKVCPELSILRKDINWNHFCNTNASNVLGKNVKIYTPCHIKNCSIGDYTYISYNSWVTITSIGKFCSIGPNLVCGWGIHPTNGISTSPTFYSSNAPNEFSFSKTTKISERKPITIGNDVFIGANVTILDGVTIGDGAIIGAGAVVSKDIPPYAIAVGCPIEIKRYRFNQEQIESLKRIKWWNFNDEKLEDVEKFFFDINNFIKKHLIIDKPDQINNEKKRQ